MLKAPIRKIGGFGLFVRYENLLPSEAWERFGTDNGVRSLKELVTRTAHYAQRRSISPDQKIGCTLLKDCRFLDDRDFVDHENYGIQFPRQVVKLKYFSQSDRIPAPQFLGLTILGDEPSPAASDLEDGEKNPERAEITVSRILRDTRIARQLKNIHSNRCQICRKTIALRKERTYSEAHHLKPLGQPHNGPDIPENIIVLCPNHHAICDFGAIYLRLEELHQHDQHRINQEYVEYHNRQIYGLI